MRVWRCGRLLAAVVGLVCGLGLWGASASAADVSPSRASVPVVVPATPSGWTYQATLYLWGTSLTGDVGVRNLPTNHVNVGFSDILNNLNGAFMGSFLAKNGDWMLLADLIWADIGADKTLNVANNPRLSYSQKLTIASGIAGYRLPVSTPNFDVYATAGFRYQRLTADMTLTSGLVPLAAGGSETKEWLDPIVGFAATYRVNERWFVNALADIGGFGVGSELTTQGFLSVGYFWTPQVSSALGYRVLYTDYRSVSGPNSDFRYDVTIHGPFASIAYHF
ncbi:hypothetical protein AZC_2785 [Azorhizobium caulinodans ORS 571]|uniref:Outer membrane protein beta-barrel domain-containing protein n=1 Tax=Azorhizobium caulinodans (strain ATCC 43989 / DSM 5975 / JCM 20966 / LMG 6465 / NBRC 14845 / NCIMB 13405 / ORS 571) TaxID=438753 RepID=A8I9G0_AZOC5|nr:hypothetical protein [Azorhizobium caulinodans]BAF88783.1 hypothetical protein AZC_2785 [Azorhizobium caulinodans ORS 571]